MNKAGFTLAYVEEDGTIKAFVIKGEKPPHAPIKDPQHAQDLARKTARERNITVLIIPTYLP